MNQVAQLFKQTAHGPAHRVQLESLERAVEALPGSFKGTAEGNDIIEHYFAPMIYGREMYMPAGFTVVGKIHKHAHLNVLLTGVVQVVTEFGNETLKAPLVWVSEPGTKRAVHVVEDCRWLCVHPNLDDGQNLDAIEQYVIAPSYEALDTFLLEGKI